MNRIKSRVIYVVAIFVSVLPFFTVVSAQAQDATNRYERYTRINNQTIVMGVSGSTTPTYFFSDYPLERDSERNKTEGNFYDQINQDKSWFVADPPSGFCTYKINIENGTWYKYSSLSVNNSCNGATVTRTAISVQSNNGAENIFFFNQGGTIRPANSSTSGANFTEIRMAPGLSSGETAYIDSADTSKCPTLLFTRSNASTLVIKGHDAGTQQTGSGSSFYQALVLKADSTRANVGDCSADWSLGTPVEMASEEALLSILGGKNRTIWSKLTDPFTFHNMRTISFIGSPTIGGPESAPFATGSAQIPTAAGGVSNSTNSGDSAAPTCAITGIGWIVCPVVSFLAGLTDSAYNAVAALLSINTLTLDEQGDGNIYNAWNAVRSLANVAFVVVFLIIIYSQLTSVGLSNYGIKKLLPKLILAAILVNISYWVCALLVDLSNFFGLGIKSFFESVGDAFRVPAYDPARDGNLIGVIAGTILAGTVVGATFFTALAVLLPLLVAIAFTILGVIVILTIRQALVILLIVIAPLAFVAYLLPNTEGLFKKWWDVFKTMLIMFPMVALVFASSALASKVITDSAGGNVLLEITGAAVAILPLITIPMIIKTSSGLIGKLIQNNPTKGLIDRSKRAAESRGKLFDSKNKIRSLNSDDNSWRRRLGLRRQARRKADFAREEKSTERNLSLAEAQYGATSVLKDDKRGLLRNTQAERMSVGMGDAGVIAAKAKAQSDLDELRSQNIKNIQGMSKGESIGELVTKWEGAAVRSDTDAARAYQNLLFESGAPGHKAWQDAVIKRESELIASGKESYRDSVIADQKLNIKANHGGMKVINNAAMNWALDTGDAKELTTLEKAFNSTSSYSKLTGREFISSKEFVQKKILELKVITPKLASEIVRDEKYNDLGGEVKTQLEVLASQFKPDQSSTGDIGANTPGQDTLF